MAVEAFIQIFWLFVIFFERIPDYVSSISICCIIMAEMEATWIIYRHDSESFICTILTKCPQSTLNSPINAIIRPIHHKLLHISLSATVTSDIDEKKPGFCLWYLSFQLTRDLFDHSLPITFLSINKLLPIILWDAEAIKNVIYILQFHILVWEVEKTLVFFALAIVCVHINQTIFCPWVRISNFLINFNAFPHKIQIFYY